MQKDFEEEQEKTRKKEEEVQDIDLIIIALIVQSKHMVVFQFVMNSMFYVQVLIRRSGILSLLAEVSFLFAFAGVTSTAKGASAMHGSKLTELSLRGGHLATECSRDTSCCVGSLNKSGI